MDAASSATASLTQLRQMRLLAGLPDDVLQEVAAACVCRLHRSGQCIVNRSGTDRDLYLVLSGRVRVLALSPNGREVSFRDLAAGDAFGEVAAIDGQPRSATVLALGEAVLARISAPALVGLMRRHWLIGERMLDTLAASVRELTDRVYALSTQNVQQRLAAEVFRLCLKEQPLGAAVTLDPAPRHADLAGRIGSYREQVTRELADLERQGLLRRGDKTLTVPDLQRLAEFVALSEGRT
jgi:CRP/FNR family transcriptional regulator, cyclic AMP receptor protein